MKANLLMEVEILYLGEVKFEAIARGHRVICDQPATNGGSDSGMTPPEFLLVSLGTCAGYYAAQYLKTRSNLRCAFRSRSGSTREAEGSTVRGRAQPTLCPPVSIPVCQGLIAPDRLFQIPFDNLEPTLESSSARDTPESGR